MSTELQKAMSDSKASGANYQAQRENVAKIKKAIEAEQTNCIWQQQSSGKSDTSNLDKLQDKLRGAETAKDLADFDDDSKKLNAFTAATRAMMYSC